MRVERPARSARSRQSRAVVEHRRRGSSASARSSLHHRRSAAARAARRWYIVTGRWVHGSAVGQRDQHRVGAARAIRARDPPTTRRPARFAGAWRTWRRRPAHSPPNSDACRRLHGEERRRIGVAMRREHEPMRPSVADCDGARIRRSLASAARSAAPHPARLTSGGQSPEPPKALARGAPVGSIASWAFSIASSAPVKARS